MNIPYVFKKCSKCGRLLVASSVNFRKAKGCKYGLRADCKECEKKYGKKYYEQNKETLAEQRKEHYEANKEAVLERCKKYRETHKEAIAEYHKKYREQNKEARAKYNKEYGKKYREQNKEAKKEYDKEYRKQNKEAITEYAKKYREENKETLVEYNKKYRETHKEALAEQQKKYYESNKEAIAERQKKYRQSPQGQVVEFNCKNRRRAKKQNQGSGITKEQWLEMMSFFNWECAYSGKYLGGKTKDRSIDHVIPLNSGGENEIWNCVPMDRSLNSSKNDKEMLEWYIKQPFYSHERLLKIYEWQEYAKKKYANSIVNE